MNILYLTIWDFQNKEKDGVAKKILQQIKILKSNNFNVDYTFLLKNEKKMYICNGEENKELGKYKYIKGIELCRPIKKYLRKNHYDWVYIRNFGRIDPWVVSILKLLNKENSKILYEIPTFPYDGEANSILAKIDLTIDRIFRNTIRKYVERIVTFSEDSYIYGIQTIKIINGIIVDDIKMIEQEKRHSGIRLIAVTFMQSYNGYERIIYGMSEYKKRGGNLISVHLIGKGPEKEKYIRLVKELQIQDCVKFYEPMQGEALDQMYESADMTLEVFGKHRQNIYVSSSLRSRESMAKGLPIVAGCRIDVCERVPFPFLKLFPGNDNIIDMFEIEKFYEDIIKDKNRLELAKEIRKYAQENIEMSVTFNPVIKFMKDRCNI